MAHDIMEPAESQFQADTLAMEVGEMFKRWGIASIPMVDMNGVFIGMIEYRRMQQLLAQRLLELENKATGLEEA